MSRRRIRARDAYIAGYGHGYRNARVDAEEGEPWRDGEGAESWDIWLDELAVENPLRDAAGQAISHFVLINLGEE